MDRSQKSRDTGSDKVENDEKRDLLVVSVRGRPNRKRKASVSTKGSLDAKSTSSSGETDTLEGSRAILRLVRDVCRPALGLSDFGQRLAEIKKHFFKREYARVFADPSNLPIYAASYVPARALCYYHMLSARADIFRNALCPADRADWVTRAGKRRAMRVCLLGGGPGSECVGFARFLSDMHVTGPDAPRTKRARGSDEDAVRPPRIVLHTFDSSDFSPLFDAERGGYAAAIRSWAPHRSVAPRCLFSVADALRPSDTELKRWCRGQVVTLLFVISELFKADSAKAEALLIALSERARPGALVLCVDSAGSFSYVQPSCGPKRWAYAILDDVFAPDRGWTCLSGANSEKFRLRQGHHYASEEELDVFPSKLQESTRYFIRLYKKGKKSQK